MTSETLNPNKPSQQGWGTDFIGDSIARFERTMRPNEGWIAALLLVLNPVSYTHLTLPTKRIV